MMKYEQDFMEVLFTLWKRLQKVDSFRLLRNPRMTSLGREHFIRIVLCHDLTKLAQLNAAPQTNCRGLKLFLNALLVLALFGLVGLFARIGFFYRGGGNRACAYAL